ncbi:MAG TPA: macro domain-containing protein [Syntrophomonadaceae bacterium]|nr:RNase III inhibitor [Syntrophomonadaceae bacterium]HOQ10523.1 macro domain-containing protein [Syntrophomonadaceae bacterium]HPU49490.1 macro domain-containing protein [Syntrophomonadaceae bacterium]HQA08645.1 macro domain-containing protein [Syntrophomonadaceae bacterium]
MPLHLVRNDITKMKVDAIVNAANSALQRGGGVCGAIFAAAGARELQEACNKIGGCKVGEAVITPGFRLPAKYIIHTVGPVWQGGKANEPQLLRNCYINSLTLALEHKCESIAFPLISSGIYGYPKDQALHVAVSAISEFLFTHEANVYLVLFDKNAVTLSEKLFSAITKYIDDNYAEEHLLRERRRGIELLDTSYHHIQESPRRSLEHILDQLDESFSEMLLRLIDEKGLTDVETYKRANIDRKLFSKIRSNKDYHPSKVTALALAIALKLNLDETLDLLSKAGYTLSPSSKFDVIIQYFIEEGNYNIFEINEALFYFDQPTLGS